jgi:hypothetical protein
MDISRMIDSRSPILTASSKFQASLLFLGFLRFRLVHCLSRFFLFMLCASDRESISNMQMSPWMDYALKRSTRASRVTRAITKYSVYLLHFHQIIMQISKFVVQVSISYALSSSRVNDSKRSRILLIKLVCGNFSRSPVVRHHMSPFGPHTNKLVLRTNLLPRNFSRFPRWWLASLPVEVWLSAVMLILWQLSWCCCRHAPVIYSISAVYRSRCLPRFHWTRFDFKSWKILHF